EYSARGPENAKELYNRRHSGMRSAVERVFSVFKNRFAIYGKMHERLLIPTQIKLVYALSCLHNIMNKDMGHETPQFVDREPPQLHEGGPDRDHIAVQMWEEYVERGRRLQDAAIAGAVEARDSEDMNWWLHGN
ncbi:hypothetical protein KEM55_000696, partial [Ascosphaera atra]